MNKDEGLRLKRVSERLEDLILNLEDDLRELRNIRSEVKLMLLGKEHY